MIEFGLGLALGAFIVLAAQRQANKLRPATMKVVVTADTVDVEAKLERVHGKLRRIAETQQVVMRSSDVIHARGLYAMDDLRCSNRGPAGDLCTRERGHDGGHHWMVGG